MAHALIRPFSSVGSWHGAFDVSDQSVRGSRPRGRNEPKKLSGSPIGFCFSLFQHEALLLFLPAKFQPWDMILEWTSRIRALLRSHLFTCSTLESWTGLSTQEVL